MYFIQKWEMSSLLNYILKDLKMLSRLITVHFTKQVVGSWDISSGKKKYHCYKHGTLLSLLIDN